MSATTALSPPAARPSLLRRLAQLVGCPAMAEDLAQEAWLRTATTLAVAHPAAFRDRVAHNLARDHLRSTSVRGNAGAAPLDDLVCGQPNAERCLMDRERVAQLEKALAALPSRRRAVFLAVRLEGSTHAVVAARHGITTAAVEKHVARTMLALSIAMARHD